MTGTDLAIVATVGIVCSLAIARISAHIGGGR